MAETENETITIDNSGEPVKPSWWKIHRHWPHFSRRTKIVSVLFALLLIGGLTALILFVVKPAIAPGGGPVASKKVITSPLTGLPTTAALADRPVTGVMIENSLDARPQSGLQDAGVVFEAIAEGGITRFLALYQEAMPKYVGPVRSLRQYYIDWANGFDASIAHVGGSPVALKRIRHGGKDLDQFFNAGSYWRVDYRPAPHNVYTDFKHLDALNHAKGYRHSHFTPWPRKADAPKPEPKARLINFAISGPEFSVMYQYNSVQNNYKRFEGGAPHTSTSSPNPKSAVLLRPKVVIAMITGYAIDKDGHHSDYNTTGTGPLFVFQDGSVTKGTWKKMRAKNMITFRDSSGNQIQLDAGQTWITVLDAKSDVHYHP